MRSDRLVIFDTTLRDGEQVLGCQLNRLEKLQVAQALETLGVDVIEAGFPVSSPGDFESVSTIARVIKDAEICALARAAEQDIDMAARALKGAARGRIQTGIGTSDYHIKYKLRSNRDDILQRAVMATRYARRFVESVEFYCEDAGRTDNEFLARVVEAVIEAGATVVNIPDTTGYCLPDEFAGKISFLRENVKGMEKVLLSVHCHDDLGLATANSVKAVLAGARQVEVTINGVGERAGNAALEEIATIFKLRSELGMETNIKLEKIMDTSRLVSSLMHMPVQPNKAIVGRNAFVHSSGIHQDGVIKHKETYEIIDPSSVGVGVDSILLTARSGRAALKHRLVKLGVVLSEEMLDKAYNGFLPLADTKKEITDTELLQLVGCGMELSNSIRLDFLKVTAGKGVVNEAKVVLSVNGEIKESSSAGNGPVDAAIKAIKKVVGDKMIIREFLVQALTKGSDDVGKVHIQVEYDGCLYYGFSASTDIVTASVEAFVDAVNKFK